MQFFFSTRISTILEPNTVTSLPACSCLCLSVCLFLCFSVSVCLSVSVSVSLYPTIFLHSFYLYLCLCLSDSVSSFSIFSLIIFSFPCLYLSLSLLPLLCKSVYSVCLYFCLSVYLSVRLSHPHNFFHFLLPSLQVNEGSIILF